MKKAKRKIGRILKDCIIGYLFILVLFIPVLFFHYIPKWQEEKKAAEQAELDARMQKRDEESEAAKNADPDENLRYFIGDVGDTDLVEAIYLCEENNTMFVCVEAPNGYTEEYLQNAYQLEKVWAYVAKDSRKPRELCIVGRGKDGTCYWTVDRYGTVADMNGNLIIQF